MHSFYDREMMYSEVNHALLMLTRNLNSLLINKRIDRYFAFTCAIIYSNVVRKRCPTNICTFIGYNCHEAINTYI